MSRAWTNRKGKRYVVTFAEVCTDSCAFDVRAQRSCDTLKRSMAEMKKRAAKRSIQKRERAATAPEPGERLAHLATALANATSEAAAISDLVREGLEGEETKRQIVRSGSSAKPKPK
jgi:hypothetical protein